MLYMDAKHGLLYIAKAKRRRIEVFEMRGATGGWKR